MENKEITLEYLASTIKEGFENAEKKTDEKFEKFAGMVARGFTETNQKIDTLEEKLGEKMDRGFEEVNTRIDDLKNEVEHHRVHVFDHKDLEHRVEVLERKTKFAGAR